MNLRTVLTIILASVFSLACQTKIANKAVRAIPFGTNHEIAYANVLWDRMAKERLVGENQKELKPFFGGAPPHGMILEIAHQMLMVDGHNGFLVVKRNYDGPGATVDSVSADRKQYLSSVTIMYQREPGYDTENQDWFWVKYQPDGQLFEKNISGAPLAMAGRILKGETTESNGGCIYCHRSAGGGDYIFYPDIKKPAPD